MLKQRVRGVSKVGNAPDLRRQARSEEFNLKYPHASGQRRTLTQGLLTQMDACKDDESRRILLGVSR